MKTIGMQRTKSVELVVLPSKCKYHHVKIEHVWQLEWQILKAVNINSKETLFSKKVGKQQITFIWISDLCGYIQNKHFWPGIVS
jgi:hypothetical protein